ncbi:TPA: hypothetical protein CPT92_02065 [Candidatus Gastranaerophilales bacterium HUM_13]|jgi:hypothetical protein|nr:MAG TPA: hypothetical protein CPT99_09125 [Candidatus Gastranaerophilales bacterium HUM_4]DAA88220.1 MAG TPA: hypothetical protein CPT87_11210 [Candidatus Gastranaerophilales bacterium HUM_5]DAB08251.1 MAG TPA: hypothetical protein CPT95_07545 [Candidatus Gastranaerophilales bacterium HUM_15]DAB09230.1 MAG TPA: hypothetical protein CPT92_02065 [Candidatus Gastranaerophilales bacterium HUM_13]DAB14908.1 MAG TPA: hypothetical protein CPU00_07660 [Candidatus Gastranaerophilales bacterium HUM_18
MFEINQLGETTAVQTGKMQTSEANTDLSVRNIDMTNGPKASKKITNNDIEKALNEPSPTKAVKQLLAKSPVGLGRQSSANELGVLGYADTGIRNYHIGAPISYTSSDGGTITVYDDMRMGQTDAGPRTTIYRTDRYEQTIIYDEFGEPVKGTIKIKDDVAGFTERQYDFKIENGKIVQVIE